MLGELEDLVKPAEKLCRRALRRAGDLNTLNELAEALRPIANFHLADTVNEPFHLEYVIRLASVEASIVRTRIELARDQALAVDMSSASIVHAVRAVHATLSTLVREIELGPPR